VFDVTTPLCAVTSSQFALRRSPCPCSHLRALLGGRLLLVWCPIRESPFLALSPTHLSPCSTSPLFHLLLFASTPPLSCSHPRRVSTSYIWCVFPERAIRTRPIADGSLSGRRGASCATSLTAVANATMTPSNGIDMRKAWRTTRRCGLPSSRPCKSSPNSSWTSWWRR